MKDQGHGGAGNDLKITKCEYGLGEDPGVSASRSYYGDYHTEFAITGEIWYTEADSSQRT